MGDGASGPYPPLQSRFRWRRTGIRHGDQRSARVEWSSALGDWEVIFSSDEPFGPADNRRIFGRQGQLGENVIQSSARFGTHKYGIRVTLPDGTVLTADSEIVVEPGEGAE